MVCPPPGGADIPLTEENKELWVSCAVQNKLGDAIRPARESLREGILDVIPDCVLQLLTPQVAHAVCSGCDVACAVSRNGSTSSRGLLCRLYRLRPELA